MVNNEIAEAEEFVKTVIIHRWVTEFLDRSGGEFV
jgi:hypothetical protein